MNAADNGIIAAKKSQSISQWKLYGVNYRPICVWHNSCPRTAWFTIRQRLYEISV